MKMINELLNNDGLQVVGYETDTYFSGTIYAIDHWSDEIFEQRFYHDGESLKFLEIEKSELIETAFYDDIVENLMPLHWLKGFESEAV